ncbi:MAG: hypothetical protein QM749_04380 [Aquabacterium sp.]
MYTGSCLCAGIRFRLHLKALEPIQICHCTQCRKAQGTPIYSRRTALPDVLRIRAGLLDEPVRATPAFHACLDDKCAWWPVDAHDGLLHHAQGVTAPGA